MAISAQKSQNAVTKENSLKKSEQPATGFSDQRPDFKAQADLKQLAASTDKGSESLKSIQRMADTSVLSFGKGTVQRAEKTPTYSGSTKAENVNLQLDAGDHVKKGSKPSQDSAGYDNLRKIGLSASGNSNPRKWVRFHALNEHSGGPGVTKNLTSTTATANHHSDWNTFESALKAAVPDNGGTTSAKVDFNVDVAYPGSSASTWIKDADASKTQSTDAADYPSGVAGRLDVGGTVTTVALDASKGTYGPEIFKKVPEWTRVDPSSGNKFASVSDWDT